MDIIAKTLSDSCEQTLENQIKALVNENSSLKTQIESNKEASRETINLLEEKLAKAEASSMKSFKDKNEELLALKNVVKNYRQEQETSKKELNAKGKLVKEKDKEIYRLEQKCENLEYNAKKLKSEISDIKFENKKLLKAKAVKVKKESVLTSTLPETDQNTLNPSSMASLATSSNSSSLATKNSSNMFPMVSNTPSPSPVSPELSIPANITNTTMALVNSTPITLGLISEQDGATFIADENSNVKAEPKADLEQNVKVDHENSMQEADKTSDETNEFDHLIPEERALLIKLKAMFENIYNIMKQFQRFLSSELIEYILNRLIWMVNVGTKAP